jgi:hypothetical protein
VEAPGTAPGSERPIPMPIYRHSHLASGVPNIGAPRLGGKGRRGQVFIPARRPTLARGHHRRVTAKVQLRSPTTSCLKERCEHPPGSQSRSQSGGSKDVPVRSPRGASFETRLRRSLRHEVVGSYTNGFGFGQVNGADSSLYGSGRGWPTRPQGGEARPASARSVVAKALSLSELSVLNLP